MITLGHVSGVHGVKGWVKIHSLTEPREAIFEYQPWLMGDSLKEVRVLEGKQPGSRLIALLEKMQDREQAEALVNQEISVPREQFPELSTGEYYWADLLGLSVELEDGRILGKIDSLLATGANDVMVVKGDRQRLIPFVLDQYVRQVDMAGGRVVVDWDPEF